MTESPGVLFERLLSVMARLRGPDGCPWDREQTRTSLKPFLIEEAYEVLEAIEVDDAAGLEEELGDLLFQVVFHARLAEEDGRFEMGDLLRRLIDKMVRRHPHVFEGASAETPAEVLVQWEAIKRREAADRGARRSAIAGVPRSLPSLLRAQRIQEKAARVNFDWPDARAAWLKVEEEVHEAREAIASGHAVRVQEEIGDVLFSLVNVARLSAIDAEEALRVAIEKFRRRFEEVEAEIDAAGGSVGSATSADLERAWDAAKIRERERKAP